MSQTPTDKYRKLAEDVLKQLAANYGCDECGSIGVDDEAKNLATALIKALDALDLCREQRNAANVFYCERFKTSDEELNKLDDAELERILEG